MHNPPHSGKIVRAFLGEIDVTPDDKHLQVSRTMLSRATLSRILNSKADISANLLLRLSAAIGTPAEIWYELQTGYGLWPASQRMQPKIKPFRRSA
jgi:addiction module HigA family antidote